MEQEEDVGSEAREPERIESGGAHQIQERKALEEKMEREAVGIEKVLEMVRELHPEIRRIIAEKPGITARELAEKLGVHGVAGASSKIGSLLYHAAVRGELRRAVEGVSRYYLPEALAKPPASAEPITPKILEIVRSRPGISGKEIAKMLNKPLSTVLSRLKVLCDKGKLVREKRQEVYVYYPKGWVMEEKPPEEKLMVTSDVILEIVRNNPGITASGIASELEKRGMKIALKRVCAKLAKLTAAGRLTRAKVVQPGSNVSKYAYYCAQAPAPAEVPEKPAEEVGEEVRPPEVVIVRELRLVRRGEEYVPEERVVADEVGRKLREAEAQLESLRSEHQKALERIRELEEHLRKDRSWEIAEGVRELRERMMEEVERCRRELEKKDQRIRELESLLVELVRTRKSREQE